MSKRIIKEKLVKVDTVIEFELCENSVAFVIECKSKKTNTLNFLIYTEENKIQGQHFSRVKNASIFVGYNKSNTSPYSLALIKANKIYITNFNTSDYMKDNFVETEVEIIVFDDTNEYDEYFKNNYINLDESDVYDEYNDYNSKEINITNYDTEKIYNQETKWYAGDLHTHTIYSDGDLKREENIRDAKSAGLDFFISTDHNLMPINWPKSDDVLVIPGMEITTEFGHFNLLFSQRNPIELNNFMRISNKDTVCNILNYARGYGLLSLNHPFSKDDNMKILDLELNIFNSIEIINDPFEHTYDKTFNLALRAWSILWNKGLDLTGIAGSDVHFREEESEKRKSIGYPRNYILAENLSYKEIKNSYSNNIITFSMKERCDLCFSNSDINGDLKGKNASGVNRELSEVELTAAYQGEENVVIEWIVDGELIDFTIGKSSTKKFSDCSWIRADFRKKDYKYLGSTNPLRVKDNTVSEKITWECVLKEMNTDIKLVVFDKDGTIIEFSDMWLHSTRNYLKSIGMKDDERKKCELALGIDGNEFLDNSILSKGTVNDAFMKISEFKSEIDPSIEGFENEMLNYIDNHPEVIIARSDISYVFSELKNRGINIAVLSNDNKKLIEKSLEMLGVLNHVEYVIGADTTIPKPSPRAFIDLKKHFNVKGDEMVYVGDSNVDLLHGNYYGKFIAFPSNVSDIDVLNKYSDVVIKDLKEILNII